ncbi:MAG: hypothetical protein J0H57_01755 [Rhodospirillales bacterium]|nr:hypothetical protein [Rhodospirillales bacterium]
MIEIKAMQGGRVDPGRRRRQAMLAHRSLCIVVLDGGRARFVRPAADRALHTEERLESPTLHARTADRSSASGTSIERSSEARTVNDVWNSSDIPVLFFSSFCNYDIILNIIDIIFLSLTR